MKKTKLNIEQRKFYNSYNSGGGNLNRCKQNAVMVRSANTYEHELKKFQVVWELMDASHVVCTEAKRNRKDANGKHKIVDVLDVTGMREIEIVHKHESDMEIKKYRDEGIIVVIVGEKFTCEVCGKEYPRRSKKNLCFNCRS